MGARDGGRKRMREGEEGGSEGGKENGVEEGELKRGVREKGMVTATIGRGRSNPREGSPSNILPHPQPSRALNHPL